MGSIVDVLNAHAVANKDQTAFTFIEDSGDIVSVTYAQLQSSANQIASAVLSLVKPGDRVVLLVPQSMDYIQTFIGCLYAGVAVVPLYPPQNNNQSQRAVKVVIDCGATLAITADNLVDFGECFDDSDNVSVVGVSTLNVAVPHVKLRSVPSESLAFMQYTSGSTGDPKGVMVSHGNIIANLNTLIEATGCSQTDIFCNWLPLFHDLGLVNTLLLPLYLGTHSVLMTPARFFRRPIRWFEAINQYRATICGAPNFAFDHCVKRIKDKDLADVDLSCWRNAFNAAEPIDPDTLSRFAEKFAPFGFNEKAAYPSYGMAEATVFISGGATGVLPVVARFSRQGLMQKLARLATKDESVERLIGCGKVQSGHSLKIVSPDTLQQLENGLIGEIWFSGPSVTQGYWNKAEKTEECFNCQIENQPDGNYLRTGDLGFVFDNQLYISGRIKDIFIVQGQNFYPQDLERTSSNAYPDLHQGGAVAFEIDQQVFMVQEVQTKALKTIDFDAAGAAISSQVFAEYGLLLAKVLFARVGTLPKTSSGKVQRSLTRETYLKDQITTVFELNNVCEDDEFVAPQTPVELYLADLWQELLGVIAVSRHDHFLNLGGQSIIASRMLFDINNRYGIKLEPRSLFEYPTLCELAEFIDQQQPDEHVQETIDAVKDPSILTFGQQQLWFVDEFEQGSSQYNLTSAITLNGKLDLAALGLSINSLIERHQVLRTVFKGSSGKVSGELQSQWTFSLVEIDLREVADSSDQLQQQLNEEAVKLFDLSQDLMVRGLIFKLSEQQNVLALTFHHIAVDGLSLKIIESELGLLYNARLNSKEAELPSCDIQFSDYAAFYNNKVTTAKQQTLDHWRDKLKGIPELHNLPMARTRATEQSYSGGCYRQMIGFDEVSQLQELANQQGCTMYMLLYTLFASLIHRYSGESDIVIGSPVAGRTHHQLDNMVGFFANPLVLRSDLSDNLAFTEQLMLSKQLILDAFEHQDIPFSLLVEALSHQRSMSFHPVFQIMFTFNESDSAGINFNGIEAQHLDLKRHQSRFDLTLEITRSAHGLELVWEYAVDLFDADAVQRMSASFDQMIHSVLHHPEQNISTLTLLSATEQSDLQHLGHGPRLVSSEVGNSIHSLIAKRVRQQPDATALVFNESRLSYGELDNRANQMAHYLIEQGVDAGSMVALCVERSVDMLVALLAILKAGGTYLPLDPSYPVARLSYMLTQSGATTLLSHTEVAGILPHSDDVVLINLDVSEVQQAMKQQPIIAPVISEFDQQNLAYVIFTSGSTGRPKGVQISHGNVLNFFAGLDQQFTADSNPQVWLAVTSICFDISVLELFWTLSRGHQIVLQPERPVQSEVGAGNSVDSVDFSLFYFASDENDCKHKFRLLLEGAKYADQNGLAAVWVPERHFHKFGGQFANPSVAAAAVAALTKRIEIRSGSVVLPLHDPIRVAEEWSMVDNLSKGRVALSIAPGWQANDFVLASDNFESRHQVMRDSFAEILTLWKGESVTRKNGVGQDCDIFTHPSPIRKELPIWITAAGNPESFKYAGSIGANVLTHFLGQSKDQLQEKIGLYRQSLVEHGFAPDKGIVTVMLHTFIDENSARVRDLVTEPFKQYLRSSIGLIKPVAEQLGLDFGKDKEQIVDAAFGRYFETSGLFGSPEQCLLRVMELIEIGVNDIGCLIDFGIEEGCVLENLPNIKQLQSLVQQSLCQLKLLEKRHENLWSPQMLVQKYQVTHMQCTPTFAKQLEPQTLVALQSILIGGEAMPEELAASLVAQLPDQVFNMYGPTETTVWTSVQKVNAGKVTIGNPMVNTDYLVLDEHQQLAPYGIPGELYIGGLSVSPGYLNLPGQTQSSFITNPYTESDYARLYKTGDLVRWTESAQLEFLGRIDNQVKLRGFRIELGEIESALLRHNLVTEAVVIANEAEDSLVAYIVADNNPDLPEQLSGFLKQSLPTYMVPGVFVNLDAMPLTANGKVDRKSLAKLDGIEASQSRYVEPTTEIERQLCQIWQNLLNKEQIGIKDNFFNVGGHSLLAARLVSAIENTLDFPLVLRTIFSYPTIAELAHFIELSRDITMQTDEDTYTVNLTI